MLLSCSLFLLVCTLVGCVSPGQSTADLVPGQPTAWLRFDGNLTIHGPDGGQAEAPAAEYAPGKRGQAVLIKPKGVHCKVPDGFDWERGTVEMWIKPGTDCRDDTYRMFFDVVHPGKGRVYLLKSGTGGANGLFMCAVDDAGTWMAASVFPGKGYSWQAGEWCHIGGSWDSSRGVLKLFFNGKEVKTTKTSPWDIGVLGNEFSVGVDPNGGNLYQGLIDEFRLYQGVATQSVIPSAKNVRGPKVTPWQAIDGDQGDLAAWNGMGAPNWLEIELPEPIKLARVTVYPGALRYAPHPSTECSPQQYVIEGWCAGRWRALSPVVSVPRYTGTEKTHRIVTDVEPTIVRRFRLNITEIYDKGCRVSSPDTPIVPPQERSVVIREIKWQDAQQMADARRRLTGCRSRWRKEIGWWQARLGNATAAPVTRGLRQAYGQRLTQLGEELDRLADRDPAELDTFAERWRNTAKWLEPWRACVEEAQPAMKRRWLSNAVGQIEVEVDPGSTAHEFYPASVALDLEIVRAALGCAIDPYQMQIVELDDNRDLLLFDASRKGENRYVIPSRFDRITPTKGTLSWTLRDRTHTRFAVHFLPKTDLPPPAMGNLTLGNCDRFFYNASGPRSLPGNLWAATVVDWDSDGRQDIIAGRWTDYCHFWKNVGTAAKPQFSEREHWRIIDDTETPIVANAKHPGLGFSIPMPVDFDNDGHLDIFMHTYYGEEPVFYRGHGSASFPSMSRGVKPTGLKTGRLAFGHLNGDDTPDVVVVQRLADKDRILIQLGNGLSSDGRPTFAPPQPLDIAPERSPFSHSRLVPALGDIDNDGDQDLFLYCAPYLWKFENVGTRQACEFAQGKILERNGRPFEMNYYYPWIAWSDWDADGDLDLIKCTGLSVYLNEGDATTLRLGAEVRPAVTGQRAMGRAGLRAHAMVDWDQDGDYDHVTLGSRGLDLRVSLWQDGLLQTPFTAGVDTNRKDWFGCPDPTEYYSLYGNVKMVDWDNDGDLDLFVTSEHSWRFGYIHHYENLGDNRFGPELELRPRPRHEYVTFVPGKNGQAAQVNQDAWVDFLSFRTAGNFTAESGSISFWFKPNWQADDDGIHTLFSTAQHPDTYGIGTQDLKQYYIGAKPELGERLHPPFAIYRTANDRLRFQSWSEHLETGALNWQAGEWHRIKVAWGTSGRSILIDGAKAATDPNPAETGPVGARLHIGSNQTFMIQRQREYSSRRAYHPKDWTFIADGAFDDFEIRDGADKALLTLPFEGNCDTTQGESGDRTTVGYRCTPGFGDLNNDGLTDMVMMIADGTRSALGELYLFLNVGSENAPALDEGTLLKHLGGDPFRCHMRTQITPVDWDQDGRIDLILSTENCGQRTNCAVDLFRNVGTPANPLFSLRQPMHTLNAMLEPHHEVKLCAVDLTGNGSLDLVTSTDPGTRVIYRSFLDEKAVSVRFVGIGARRIGNQ